jgi:hypothetical protein
MYLVPSPSQLQLGCRLDDEIPGASSPRNYDLRLLAYAQFALDVIDEHDLPFSGNETLDRVLKAALAAYFNFALASIHTRTTNELESLLHNVLLFALRPACGLEVI